MTHIMDSIEIVSINQTVTYQGRKRLYIVAGKELKGAPRFFITYNAGFPIISEEVPAIFRPPMVIHELAEFETFKDQNGRCASALQEELNYVPDDQKPEYLPFRRDVLNILLEYHKTSNPNSAFLPEVEGSIKHIDDLLRRR